MVGQKSANNAPSTLPILLQKLSYTNSKQFFPKTNGLQHHSSAKSEQSPSLDLCDESYNGCSKNKTICNGWYWLYAALRLKSRLAPKPEKSEIQWLAKSIGSFVRRVSKDVAWRHFCPLTDSRQGTLHTETSILRIKRRWRVKIRQTTDIFAPEGVSSLPL